MPAARLPLVPRVRPACWSCVSLLPALSRLWLSAPPSSSLSPCPPPLPLCFLALVSCVLSLRLLAWLPFPSPSPRLSVRRPGLSFPVVPPRPLPLSLLGSSLSRRPLFLALPAFSLSACPVVRIRERCIFHMCSRPRAAWCKACLSDCQSHSVCPGALPRAVRGPARRGRSADRFASLRFMQHPSSTPQTGHCDRSPASQRTELSIRGFLAMCTKRQLAH